MHQYPALFHKIGHSRKFMILASILLLCIGLAVTQIARHRQLRQGSIPYQPLRKEAQIQKPSPGLLNEEPLAAEPQQTSLSASSVKYTAPLAATADNFQQIVSEAPVPVLVRFGAEWCGVCRQAAPILDAAALEFSGLIMVITIDIDTDEEIATRYEIHGTPTFLMFKNGHIIGRQSGFGGQQHLLGFIKRYL